MHDADAVFRRGAVAATYNPSQLWYNQAQAIANQVVTTFVCPTDDKDNPLYIAAFDYGTTATSSLYPVPSPTGQQGGLASSANMVTFNGFFGALDYLFCAGVTDAVCDRPELAPSWERGMFAISLQNNPASVTDGLSNTLMMGEDAQGSKFALAASYSLTPYIGASGPRRERLVHAKRSRGSIHG